MTISKKIITTKKSIAKFIFAGILIISGILLNYFNLGKVEFFSYNSVGSYLIFCGFIVLITSIMIIFTKKNKIYDERNEKISIRAMSWVWFFLFFGGFIIMIIDGISPINIRISEFISYSICALLLIYSVFYYIYSKRM